MVCLVLGTAAACADETITISLPASLAEGASGQGTLTLSTAPVGFALAISLSTIDPRIAIPFTVTVQPGQTTANFTVSYPENPFIEDSSAPATVTVHGSPGWTGSTAQVSLTDNEVHNLLILAAPLTLTEGDPGGASFKVYSSAPVRSDLTVTIQTTNSGEVNVTGAMLSIPAGQSESYASCTLVAVDDTARDGAQNVTITASAAAMTSATLQATVKDNDPASISWPAIASPVTARATLPVELRALTIDGDPVALAGPIAVTATTNGQPSAVLPSSLASIGVTGATNFSLLKAGATVLIATAGDITASSAPFTVQAAALSAFEFSPVATPMQPGVARTLSLRATDAFGNTATSFNGTADLLALAQTRTDQIGTGLYYESPVLSQATKRMRSQMLIRASSLAGAGRIYSLSLELLGAPTRPYDELTIRLKHTSQFFAPGSWDGDGWTVVRQGAWMPSGAGWVTIPFQVPFDYNGSSNLYVDVSFVNDAPGGAVFCQGTGVSGFFAYWYGTNDPSFGLPTTWSGNAVPANLDFRPNMRLGFGSVLAVNPTTTTAFVNGVWTGDVTLTGSAPQHVVLRASSGAALGQSDVIDLGYFPPAAPVMNAEPTFTQGTSNTVSWGAVANAGSYYVEASTAFDFSWNVSSSGWIPGTSFAFTGLSEGTCYFRVKARRADDTAVESAWSDAIYSVQDATGPVVTVSGLADGAGGPLFTSRNAVTIGGYDSDSCGVVSLDVNGQAATIGGFGAWSANVTMPPAGDLPVSIVAVDSVGNQSTRTITITRAADADGDGLPDAWQLAKGLRGPGLTATDAGPNGDPDHDGIPNLMEFARGLNPLVSDPATLLISRRTGFGPFAAMGTQIEYDRQVASLDFTYLIEESTDLQTWELLLNGNESTSPNAGGATEHVTVFQSDPVIIIFPGSPPPAPVQRKFVRLVVAPRP
ncbi:MAG: fibronectin type III domain-containing protein [Verrucomicrobiaceae bacterium]|nr:fibronectin type III domain-containing protein [Verrucomicrobiaceae bacterium]